MAKPTYERRQHKRHSLGCPARLADETGACLAAAKTINISDGGLLMPAPAEAAPKPGRQVFLKLSVPRDTPNTFLMEPVAGKAVVVRHEPADGGARNVAVRFDPPLTLDLEV